MAFKFERLIVWQRSLDLCAEINSLAKTFPKDETFSLSLQLRKAADSVNLNIAEGCTGQSNSEFSRFLGYSLRSAIEVVSCLFIAKRKGYLEETAFCHLYHEYESLIKMITRLRDSLTCADS